MLHRLDAERRSDVGFAGAWATDQHHVVGALDERAAVKLLDHGLVDLAGRKVEAGQILKGGEAGSLELIGNGPDLPLGKLGLEQLGQDRHGGIEGRCTLFKELAHSLGHAMHLEAAEHDHNSGTGRVMTHGEHPYRAASHSEQRWPWAPGARPGPAAHQWRPPGWPCHRPGGAEG